MKRLLLALMLLSMTLVSTYAQRRTDLLDRGLVAMKVSGGVYCSWRILAEEYYDVTYNLYRDGTPVAEGLEVSNYTDAAGTAASTYTVEAVVRGTKQAMSKAAPVWAQNYLEVPLTHEGLKSTYVPNDACCADVDGDGELEILLKYDNASWAGNGYNKAGYEGEYVLMECLKLDGTRLWWINLGPNMADFQNNEQNIVAYDWDGDGKAECVMRAADGTTIHTAKGETIVIGDATKNYFPGTGSQWFVHDGAEFLLYLNGETGEVYHKMDYPLKRLESGESSLEAAWGDGYGHRSTKHFFGAPYLDGRKPSIFLARGIYTRHKMIALDVNPTTHKLTTRWTWNMSDGSSPYFGQGFHNYGIADVDWDGRDEICFGSMVIDDNGKGLSTTGLGHGDSQHHGDFDPYRHGQEIFTCQEDRPSNCFRDGTTAKILYRLAGGSDDGRAMCGNFSNDYPGAMGFSAHDDPISCVTASHQDGLVKNSVTDNFRIYWDGDLQEETYNYTNGKNTEGGIYKYKKGIIETLAGSMSNNDTKGTPCYQGDVFGDWREEVIMRTAANNIRIYTTKTKTPWRNYTLWHDHQYRNAMVWQMCGYNQPPHVSYFLGEIEGITVAPPPLTMTGRDEVTTAIDASMNDRHALLCTTGNATVTVSEGAAPYIFTDNAPSWVQGTNSTSTTNPKINYTYYTHTLTGAPFTGSMRLVKQGDGTLVLPNVTQTYTGPTEIWAGTLSFDGTLQSSHVWLNRHASLSSNGGQFLGGIEAFYNSTLLPGGENNVGTMTVSDLVLGFGANVAFDEANGSVDQLQVTNLTIEKKVWKNGGGPQFDAPVFKFPFSVTAGKYALIKISGTLTGSIDNITLSGMTLQKSWLTLEDGTIYLNVQDYVGKDLTWTGATDGIWDLDHTQNFVDANGQADVFVSTSNVVFNDDATTTSVTVKGTVAPKSVTFSNETKAFTLTGDSLMQQPLLVKNGAGRVTINNQNYMGNTTVNGGTLEVSTLANNSGTDVGALGTVKQTITLNDGAALSVSQSITSNQNIIFGSGAAAIDLPSGVTLRQEGNLNGTSASTLVKRGDGTLIMGSNVGVGKLVVAAGRTDASFSGNLVALPATVEFQGGTLYDALNDGLYATNNANFVVPKGQKGIFYLDTRCNYKGTLTGEGTFTVHAAGVRNYLQGDWSQFEGTLIPAKTKRGSYDPWFCFDNTKGLPKATLQLNDGMDFDNNGKSMPIGMLSGSGTLVGSGTYYVGDRNEDMAFTVKSTSPIVKRGTAMMSVTAGNIQAPLAVENGLVRIFGNTTTLGIGSNALTLRQKGQFEGMGLFQSIIANSGTTVTPRGRSNNSVGTITTNAAITINQGATLVLTLRSATSNSKVEPATLTLNGTVKIELGSSFTPAVGQSFTLWTVKNTLNNNATYDLPELPAGMGWDVSGLKEKTGVLRIVAADGIEAIDANSEVTATVYNATGQQLFTLTTTKARAAADVRRLARTSGTYIVKLKAGQQSGTLKVLVR